MMTMPSYHAYLRYFIDALGISAVRRKCYGELFEFHGVIGPETVVYTYGNGELYISDSLHEWSFEISNVRGFDELVEM